MNVSTEDLGSARLITWDHQARLNAWDLPTMTAIADALESAGEDETVRLAIVRGAGDNFSAGDDLFAAIEADSAAWAQTIDAFQRLTRVALALPCRWSRPSTVFASAAHSSSPPAATCGSAPPGCGWARRR